MQDASSSPAAQQIRRWYEENWDALLDKELARTGTSSRERRAPDAAAIARAHEQAWRHGVVNAQRTTTPDDWAEFDVDAESRTYWELLRSTAARYGIRDADIADVQTAQGYRHHPR